MLYVILLQTMTGKKDDEVPDLGKGETSTDFCLGSS